MNENTNEPVVELTAGEMLRNARTTGRRKREIPTISKQLCIREEFLEALEQGNYTVIPELVYILGFARNYAMELGLNPDEIVNKIKREMGLVSDCSSDCDTDVGDGAGSDAAAHVRFFSRGYQFVRRNWKWFAGGVAAIVVVIGLTIALWPRGTETNSAPVVIANVAETTEPEYNIPVRERFGTDNRADATVILQANRTTNEAGTWVEIKDARGRTELSRVLMPGDVYYVPVNGKYTATFGNAAGIDIWVNGKLAPAVGGANVRKSGISLAPSTLMPNAEAAK